MKDEHSTNFRLVPLSFIWSKWRTITGEWGWKLAGSVFG
jgi:hypothetical protein